MNADVASILPTINSARCTGRRQQRLERAALALAGSRVDREIEAADQHRHETEVRHHPEDQQRAAGRRRDVERAHVDGLDRPAD